MRTIHLHICHSKLHSLAPCKSYAGFDNKTQKRAKIRPSKIYANKVLCIQTHLASGIAITALPFPELMNSICCKCQQCNTCICIYQSGHLHSSSSFCEHSTGYMSTLEQKDDMTSLLIVLQRLIILQATHGPNLSSAICCH